MSKGLVEIPEWTEDDPERDRISALVDELARIDGEVDLAGKWSEPLWKIVTDHDVPKWSLPPEHGGAAIDRPLLTQRYARIAEGSMTAAFILSQHDAAVRRLVAVPDHPIASDWLKKIAAGEAFGTVGISQLTTSRRLGSQALLATEVAGGYRLDGGMPWVTAAERADFIVSGAVMEDGRQLLIALPADRPGVVVKPAFELAALEASRTTEVACDGVMVADGEILAGPSNEIAATPGAVGTGGLETSALALGQARAALARLAVQAEGRSELVEPVQTLGESWDAAWTQLLDNARGEPDAIPANQIRAQANTLALSCTQAYLTARKGTGFLRSEPAQRWARQALFFLVWSCPSPIAQAAIRDFAGSCSLS
jgi:alkylation response protein AidB-like acyl-CoA dehydrogenase